MSMPYNIGKNCTREETKHQMPYNKQRKPRRKLYTCILDCTKVLRTKRKREEKKHKSTKKRWP